MRRFSISRLMLMVAFLASNFAAVRFLTSDSKQEQIRISLLGLLPLVDCVILSFVVWVPRLRIRLLVRPRGDRSPFLPLFSLMSGVLLVLGFALSLMFADCIYVYVEYVAEPIVDFLDSRGIGRSMEEPGYRFIIVPLLVGLVLSGPLIVLALVLSFGLGRLKVEITPRGTLDAVGPS